MGRVLRAYEAEVENGSIAITLRAPFTEPRYRKPRKPTEAMEKAMGTLRAIKKNMQQIPIIPTVTGLISAPTWL
jgi:hypothetical protein